MTIPQRHNPWLQQGLLALIVVLALAGAWRSGRLLINHDGGWNTHVSGDKFLNSLCVNEQSQSATCTEVVDSKWGGFDLYWGSNRFVFPTSFFGLAYFIAVAVWFGLLFPMTRRTPWIPMLSLGMVSMGLIASIVLMFIMTVVLDGWCSQCALVHAINGTIVIAAFAAIALNQKGTTDANRSTRQSTTQMTFGNPHVLTALTTAIIAMTLVGTYGYFHGMSEARRQWRKARGYADVIAEFQRDEAFLLREFAAQPKLDSARLVASQGDGETIPGKTTITIFVDHANAGRACFHKRFANEYAALFGPDATIDIRSYPANHADDIADLVMPTNPQSIPAFAFAAAREMDPKIANSVVHQHLLKPGPARDGKDYSTLAEALKTPIDTFLAMTESAAVAERVNEDVRLAHQAGITQAPAVILNGRRVPTICLQSSLFWHAISTQQHHGGLESDEPAPLQNPGHCSCRKAQTQCQTNEPQTQRNSENLIP
ncbi:MAG: vitamin K epoxide reductase family protein [Phycisphaerae bacterium]